MRTLGFLVVLAAFLGCGPTQKCGPGNCSGCCDAAGTCQTGNTNVNCGNGGLLCNACFVGQACSLGICSGVGTGGGSASGGGGGSATGGGGGSSTGGGGGSSTGGGGGSAIGGGGGSATGGGGGSAIGGGGGSSTGGGGGSAIGGGGGSSTGGGGGATGGGSGSSWTTWCTSYVNSACDTSVRCGQYASATVCRSFANAAGICATTPALNDGREVLDSTQAAACLSSMSGACDTIDMASCSTARHGTGQLNQGCFGNNECVTNLYCDLSSTCPGLCRAATQVGQALTAGSTCVSGSYAYGGVCLALTPIGQSCAPVSPQTTDRTCVPDAFCQTATKVCTAKRLSGQSCSASSGECAGMLGCYGGLCGALGASSAACDSTRPCRADLKCGTANVCVPLGALNAPCTSAFGDCQYDLICDKPTGSSTGTCQPIHTLGQSCTYYGYQCGLFNSGHYCTATSVMPTGICALKKGTGASCASYEECSSGTCTGTVCAGCVDPTP